MFLNILYEIRRSKVVGQEAFFSVLMHADHPLYAGHFPGNPVTPGVVLAEIVKELLGLLTEKKVKMKTMRQCKFLAVHNPELTPEIDIEIKWTEEDGYLVQATGKSSKETFFRLSAHYQIV